MCRRIIIIAGIEFRAWGNEFCLGEIDTGCIKALGQIIYARTDAFISYGVC